MLPKRVGRIAGLGDVFLWWQGDWIFHSPYVIEAVTQIASAANKAKDVKVQDRISFERRNHTRADIVFAVGPETGFRKNEQRQLEVRACARACFVSGV